VASSTGLGGGCCIRGRFSLAGKKKEKGSIFFVAKGKKINIQGRRETRFLFFGAERGRSIGSLCMPGEKGSNRKRDKEEVTKLWPRSASREKKGVLSLSQQRNRKKGEENPDEKKKEKLNAEGGDD